MTNALQSGLSALQQSKTNQVLAKLGDVSEAWRLFPHTFAPRASRGKWLPYPHLAKISKEITRAIVRGKGRIVVSIPPRHGKSELISKWVPSWYLDRDPEGRVILASYEADFAARWGRQVRTFFETTDLSQTKIQSDSSAADRWETNFGGAMNTAGVGGAFTGKGADLLIIDDPLKNWEQAMSAGHREKVRDWFKSTFYTRAEPNATIIVLMTRWHEDDLAGYLINEHDDDWLEINMPATSEGNARGEALCPERYTTEDLGVIRRSIGSFMYGSLYDQKPVPPEGGVFKRHWFRYWVPAGYPIPMDGTTTINIPTTFDEVIQSWDLPFDDASDASSYIAGQIWSRKSGDRFLHNEFHEQGDYPAMKAAMRKMHAAHPDARTKVVENKAAGAPLIKDMKKEIPGLVPWNPKGSKEARAIACSGEVESGNVYLPHPTIAPWVREFIEEVCTFPKSKLKDRVDAMSQALLRFSKPKVAGSMNFESLTRVSPIGGAR